MQRVQRFAVRVHFRDEKEPRYYKGRGDRADTASLRLRWIHGSCDIVLPLGARGRARTCRISARSEMVEEPKKV